MSLDMIRSNMFLCINMIYMIFFSSVTKIQSINLTFLLGFMDLIDVFIIMQSDVWQTMESCG